MIVDDSVVIRGALSHFLGSQPDIRIVGIARNGRDALNKVALAQPDVLILDIEMPEMDGLELLRALQGQHKRIAVLIFSSHTKRGARVTIEALSLWAYDYVLKPSTMNGETAEAVKHTLLSKLRELVSSRIKTPLRPDVRSNRPIAAQRLTDHPIDLRTDDEHRVDAVAIAASTGGPKALMNIMSLLPPTLSVPILIVQHMPPIFTLQLAKSLSKVCQLHICEASHNIPVESGCVYIAPGGHHLGLTQTRGGQVRTRIHDAPPENQCRPAADVLFRDVATVYGQRALGVVLTGMGRDGTVGCRALSTAGGAVVVQDRATSTVWSMPGHVAASGTANAVVPLDDIAAQIVRRARGPR